MSSTYLTASKSSNQCTKNVTMDKTREIKKLGSRWLAPRGYVEGLYEDEELKRRLAQLPEIEIEPP